MIRRSVGFLCIHCNASRVACRLCQWSWRDLFHSSTPVWPMILGVGLQSWTNTYRYHVHCTTWQDRCDLTQSLDICESRKTQYVKLIPWRTCSKTKNNNRIHMNLFGRWTEEHVMTCRDSGVFKNKNPQNQMIYHVVPHCVWSIWRWPSWQLPTGSTTTNSAGIVHWMVRSMQSEWGLIFRQLSIILIRISKVCKFTKHVMIDDIL